MTVEINWIILVAFVAIALGSAIFGHFKELKDSAKDSAEFIAFLKRSEEKESEDKEC